MLPHDSLSTQDPLAPNTGGTGKEPASLFLTSGSPVLGRGGLLWWTLYAAAFGYVEALVVVYVRRLTHMPDGLDYAQIWAARGLAWNGASIVQEMTRLGIRQTEYGREIATLLLLLGPAMAAGRGWRERLGLYLFTFAIWDETYYLWLKLWTGFPQSLGATDIYFLVPIAWYGAVWFPILVVMPALIALSLWLLTRPSFAAVSEGPALPASAAKGPPVRQ